MKIFDRYGNLIPVITSKDENDTYDRATDSLEALRDGMGTLLSDLQASADDFEALLLNEDYGLEVFWTLFNDLIENVEDIDTIEIDTDPLVRGRLQTATTTESLNQAAGTYDLFIGTAQAVVLEKLSVKMPTGNAGGAITSISIQTDDVAPGVIIPATLGVVANLTSEAELYWTGVILINTGTKIQLTIAGGAHGSAYTATIVAECRAVAQGGYLA